MGGRRTSPADDAALLLVNPEGPAPTWHSANFPLCAMYGRRPRCKRNLTFPRMVGCGHVFGLLLQPAGLTPARSAASLTMKLTARSVRWGENLGVITIAISAEHPIAEAN